MLYEWLFAQLIFSDEDINLSVGVIYVRGHMRIGGENCRVLSQITITFNYVENQKIHFPDLGIVVNKTGQLDMHGEEFSPTWTRLSSTAKAGDYSISLQVAMSYFVLIWIQDYTLKATGLNLISCD